MTVDALTKEMVEDTSMWTLALRLSGRGVDIAVFSDMEDGSLLYRHVDPAAGSPSSLRVIEDAVYENPLVLSTFRNTFISIEADASMLMPGEIDDPVPLAQALMPGDDREWATDRPGGGEASLCYSMPRGCMGFIRRTFPGDTVVRSHLGFLTTYFLEASRRSRRNRLLGNLRQGMVDIVAVEGNHLVKAVTFRCQSAMDAAYFILACNDELNAGTSDSEIILAGDTELRAEVMPVVRRFAANVVPVIFPPRMFRAGKDAMKMPFDLTVSPLCE